MAEVSFDQFAEETIAKFDLLVRKVSLEAFSEVILRSPVDTGRFRGDWQVAIGNIPTGQLVLEDKTGQATIGRVTAATQGLEAGMVINLANNLPYAIKLEYGSSSQAPAGMVRLTAQRWQPIVDKAVAEIVGQS